MTRVRKLSIFSRDCQHIVNYLPNNPRSLPSCKERGLLFFRFIQFRFFFEFFRFRLLGLLQKAAQHS